MHFRKFIGRNDQKVTSSQVTSHLYFMHEANRRLMHKKIKRKIQATVNTQNSTIMATALCNCFSNTARQTTCQSSVARDQAALQLHYTVSRKKETKMFFVISPIKLGRY